MMVSSDDKLTPLQRALLVSFFEHERRFYLTGGAALAGFYLRHRRTTDLDLFTFDANAFAHVSMPQLTTSALKSSSGSTNQVF